MTLRNRPLYAARLNAFKALGGDVADWIDAAGTVGGLTAADLNYPDHLERHSPGDLTNRLGDAGLALNGLAMRYYSDPAFAIGAFTNPDPAVRRAAIDLTKRGLDACAEMGGQVMTLWMGQDGFDYAFQLDYARAWDDTVGAIREVADHAPSIDIALEYKPDEPRCFALMPDIGQTLLGVREADRANVGVTLDFAHVLYAKEMPAHSAVLVDRHARLMGVHLNDGYGARDDGLMVGTVHAVATVELFVALGRMGHEGAIYFDTFPDAGGLHPVEEARTNLAITERLREVAAGLSENADLAAAIARQDAALSQRIVAAALYG